MNTAEPTELFYLGPKRGSSFEPHMDKLQAVCHDIERGRGVVGKGRSSC